MTKRLRQQESHDTFHIRHGSFKFFIFISAETSAFLSEIKYNSCIQFAFSIFCNVCTEEGRGFWRKTLSSRAVSENCCDFRIQSNLYKWTPIRRLPFIRRTLYLKDSVFIEVSRSLSVNKAPIYRPPLLSGRGHLLVVPMIVFLLSWNDHTKFNTRSLPLKKNKKR